MKNYSVLPSKMPCLVLFTWHASAVSHVTGLKIELLNRTLKMTLVQGQNICYIRKEY